MENFVPIKGFEKTYLINKETQQIYSLIKKRLLKGSINSNGYISFHLKSENGKIKIKKLHRLVAETFIPNPNNFSVINHKNGNKLDNRVENLEWCTHSHNNKEAYKLGLRKVSDKTRHQFKRDCLTPKHIEKAKENLRKSKEKAIQKSKEINSYKVKLIKENETYEFESCSDASKYLNVAKTTICRALKRKNNFVKGYEIKKIS